MSTFSKNSVFFYDQMMSTSALTVRVVNGEEVVVRGIYKDDFHIGVQNQWQSGGNSMLKMIVDVAASFITSRDVKLVSAVAEKAAKWAESNNNEAMGDLGGASESTSIAQGIGAMAGKLGEYANSHIFTADDFFKSFKGSSVTFPINLTVTLITDELRSTNSRGSVVSRDVYDDLRKILDITIGEYENPKELAHFVGIQKAPNNFKSTFFNLNTPIEGSVSVIYGDQNEGGYRVDNMLVSSANFLMSKTQVQIAKGVFRPLYIDVQLMLEPGKMMTKDDILKVFSKNSGI